MEVRFKYTDAGSGRTSDSDDTRRKAAPVVGRADPNVRSTYYRVIALQ